MPTPTSFSIKSRYAPAIRWSKRGSCGNAGCTDPECCCALCRQPIGVSEDDPRWDDHDEECDGCEVCSDSVPPTLFRGEGKAMEQAAFHNECFGKVVHFRSGCQSSRSATAEKPVPTDSSTEERQHKEGT